MGGSETTRHAISGGTYQLLRRPADVAFLRAHPEAIPNAVEEMVRWTTPFVRMQRTLLADHAMHGITMKEGDKLIMIYPAANRDPRAFDRPQEFDVRRKFDKPALAFGLGKHYCLGASLARLEIRVFLEEMLRRLPRHLSRRGTSPPSSRPPSCEGFRLAGPVPRRRLSSSAALTAEPRPMRLTPYALECIMSVDARDPHHR